ncbi:MAG: 3-hydroxyacyl-ACP dehydratase FabZ family protein [Planctomycetota bacterium]
MSREQVLAAIPHRPPFLWVDEVLNLDAEAKTIHCRKFVDPDTACFAGHYPDFPLLPGVLVCEAIYQTGAVLLATVAKDQLQDGLIPVLTRGRDSRFRRMVRPGETLDLEVQVEDGVGTVFQLKGTAKVGDELAVKCSFSVALVPRPQE